MKESVKKALCGMFAYPAQERVRRKKTGRKEDRREEDSELVDKIGR
jgi:hypothetical protein